MRKEFSKISIILTLALILTSTHFSVLASSLSEEGAVVSSAPENSEEEKQDEASEEGQDSDGAEINEVPEENDEASEKNEDFEESDDRETEVLAETEVSESAENNSTAEAPVATENEVQPEASETAENGAQPEASESAENGARPEASETAENGNQADVSEVAESDVQTEKTEANDATQPGTGEAATVNEGSAASDPGVVILKEGETVPESEGTEEISEDSDDEDEDSDRKKKDKDEEEEEDEQEASLDQLEEEEGDSFFVPGNIDMDMSFSDETVKEIARATSETQIESGDGASLFSIEDGRSYINDDVVITTQTNPNRTWSWAYTAATLADINLKKKGIDKKVSVEGIVRTVYNPGRHDYYGETWEKANDVTDFNVNTVGNNRDYTGYADYLDKNGHLTTPTNWTNDAKYRIGERDACLKRGFSNSDANGYIHAPGNLINAVFNFERWGAPVSDTSWINSFEGNTDIIGGELENAIWVPNTDIDSIKNMIRNYGAAGIQIMVPNPWKGESVDSIRENAEYNKANLFKFAKIRDGYTTNHTVALIGWDDDVPVDRFAVGNQKPEEKGGFLAYDSCLGCKYWISYEDAAFKLYNGNYKYAVAVDFESSKKYDYTYGYDGTNHFDTYSVQQIFSIFRSGHSGESSSGKVEMLKSVGVGVQDTGKYRLSIYYGYNSGAANNEKQYLNLHEMASKTVKIDYPGYHTIELDEPILFYKGDEISVCFEKEDGTNFKMLVDGFYDEVRDTEGGTKENKNRKTSTITETVKDANGNKLGEIVYNSFSYTAKDKIESYFATYSGSKKVVSGNGVSVPNKTGKYMCLSPRMRLYTSTIQMPSNIDQTMLDIKLKKYIWLYNDGKAVCPDPEILIDFTKTRPKVPKDRGGRTYENALVMYNHYKTPSYASNKEAGIAAVIVRGTGDVFSGEISMPFKIVKGEQRIEKCKVFGLDPQMYRSGSDINTNYNAIKNNLVIRYYVNETKHYVTLTEGVDYKIGSIEEVTKGSNKPGGKLSVMITGLGTFKNTIKPKFKIQKQKNTIDKPLSDGDIEVKLSYTDEDKNTTRWLNGDGEMAKTEDLKTDAEKEHTIVLGTGELPELPYIGKRIVIDIDKIYDFGAKKELQSGVHYKAKISFKNNKKPGMATLTIKALKGSGYTGKIVKRFMITPLHITTDATVKFPGEHYYTGNPIKAKPSVKLYGNKISNKDLYVAYENNTGSSSGEATARGTVFGSGKYTGYVGYGTFTIKPKKT